MRVADVMSSKPVTIEPDTPVSEAFRVASAYGVQHLVVTELQSAKADDLLGTRERIDCTIHQRRLADAGRAHDSDGGIVADQRLLKCLH